jgi:hypothetical protein
MLTGSVLSMLPEGTFFSHGFRSVTMDDLALELGISKKTLYAYFPGSSICSRPCWPIN